jgi:hypothetical protein
MRFIHHVEMLFINQHGLTRLPLLPRFLGKVLEDLATLLARKWWRGQFGQVFLKEFAKYSGRHKESFIGLKYGMGLG